MTDGACIAAGVVAFLLFAIYDINSVKQKCKWIKSAFFIGALLLATATGILMVRNWERGGIGGVGQWVALVLAAVFFIFLIYTLFFAIPFSETYIKKDGDPQVCAEGMYALCRHPGVLWFVGLYICLAAAVPEPSVILAGVIFCVCNLLYVIVQDVWTFPNCFADYRSYKKKVPFLIPTGKSMSECIRTLKRERKHV